MPSCRAHGTYGGRSKKDILESRAFGALNWDPLLPRRMRGVLALKGRGSEALDTTGQVRVVGLVQPGSLAAQPVS